MRRILVLILATLLLTSIALPAAADPGDDIQANPGGGDVLIHTTYTPIPGTCYTRAGAGQRMNVAYWTSKAAASGCYTPCTTATCWEKGAMEMFIQNVWPGTQQVWTYFQSIRNGVWQVWDSTAPYPYPSSWWRVPNKNYWTFTAPQYGYNLIKGSPCYDTDGLPQGAVAVTALDYFYYLAQFNTGKGYGAWDGCYQTAGSKCADANKDGSVSGLDGFLVLSQFNYDCTVNPY